MTLDVYSDLFDDDLDAVADVLNHQVANSSVGKMWAEGIKGHSPEAQKSPTPVRSPEMGQWLRRASIP